MQRKKAGNRRFKILLGIFITFITLFFVLGFSVLDRDHQHKLFSNIEAMNILSSFITEEINEDKCLGELVPVDSFLCKVKWNNTNYRVYAYVFEDDSQCMQYVKNRKMPYYGSDSYHLSSNVLFSSKYIICSNEKVLYIEGAGLNSLFDFLDYLGQDFDILLDKGLSQTTEQYIS